MNRLIEAIYKFCTTRQSEIDGINVGQEKKLQKDPQPITYDNIFPFE